MNKKEYLKCIIDEARNILNTAELNGQYIVNNYTKRGEVSGYDIYEKK